VAQFLGLNVLRGRVVAAQGEFSRVALADGVEIWGSAASPLPEGTAALLCVRKEHVAVRKVAAAAAALATAQPPAEQVFPAEIRTASFLGLQEEYIVAIGGVELGSIQPPHGLRAGERVEAVIRPADCVLFADAAAG
jgi:hypothetical protein